MEAGRPHVLRISCGVVEPDEGYVVVARGRLELWVGVGVLDPEVLWLGEVLVGSDVQVAQTNPTNEPAENIPSSLSLFPISVFELTILWSRGNGQRSRRIHC